MKRELDFILRRVCLLIVMFLLALAPARLFPEPPAAAAAAINS